MINKIDASIIGLGFLVSLTSWMRYFLMPSDYGETILAFGYGILLILIGFLHHNQKKIEKRITKINKTLDDVETYLADMNEDDTQ